MRILLLGKNGQLGWELHRTLSPLGEVIAPDFPEIDLTQGDKIRQQVRLIQPTVIVNASAYTAVDRAESEPEIAMAVNGLAPGLLAEEALKSGAAVVHFSTDYVFDGTKGSQYVETDIPNPIGVYSQSKLNGDMAIEQVGGAYLILRTSWMYSLRRDNFLTKVLTWARAESVLRIVTNHIGSPTSARMLAETTALTLAMGRSSVVDWIAENRGTYHVAGEGSASRFELAQEILRCDPHPEEQTVLELQPASSKEFPSPAPRPPNSSLNCNKFTQRFGLRLPPWQEALRMMLDTS